MGILCTQENNGKTWIIRVREKWTILNREELDKISAEMLNLGLSFTVTPSFECFIMQFVDSKIEFKDDYRKFKNALDTIIEIKDKAVKAAPVEGIANGNKSK